MAKLKIQQTNSVSGFTTEVHDSYVSPTLISGNHIGTVGGETSQTIPSIQCTYRLASTEYTGFILAQKGSQKFRVQETGTNANVCTATLENNAAGSLSANLTMTIAVTASALTSAAVAAAPGNVTVGTATVATANVVGIPSIGQTVTSTGITGLVTVSSVTVVGSDTVLGLTFPLQDVSNVTANLSTSFNAKRISNKFVHDWQNRKYRTWFSTASNTFVKVDNA